MTLTTQTAPITVEEKKAIKEELVELIANDRSIQLPAMGCEPSDLARIIDSLKGRAWDLYRQLPDRESVLPIVVVKAAQHRNTRK